MSPDRRAFLAASLGAAAVLSGRRAAGELVSRQTPEPAHPMRILILGGTNLLGPHLIAYALGRGHRVTTFTRGRTQPTVHRALFEHVERLIGDRESDLNALRGRAWDAVIDNSGRRPDWVRDTSELLRDRVETYLYTSTIGVYYPYVARDIDETFRVPLAVPEGLDEPQRRRVESSVRRAQSERIVRSRFGDERAIVVRPTHLMGPGDGNDRFTYWPVRLARGGDVMVPGRPDDPVQFIDARDVAEWMIRLVETGTAGTFNAVGPAVPTGVARFVHGAAAAFRAPTSFVTIDDYEFLAARGVSELVPWRPPVGDYAGAARISAARGVANGLRYRPLADSIRDLAEWWWSDAVSSDRRYALADDPSSLMAREAEIIRDWRARVSTTRPAQWGARTDHARHSVG